jgi:predicted NBD/HSP70 family sugar kinase
LLEDCKDQILVFDVGGSHIAASLFHPRNLTLGEIHVLPVLEAGGAADFFAAFESLAEIMLPAPSARSGVAVAIPNPFDYDEGISYMRHKYRELYGNDLRRGLAERLGCDPDRVHFLNDATAFLIGELNQGAATGTSRSIGIALGTGVGSAFAVDGKIVVAGRGVPPRGEIWDLPYRNSTVENFISTRSIQLTYEQLTGIRADVRDIAALGGRHPHARETFEMFGEELGAVLKERCLEFAPQRIVLGGGIAHAAELFLPAAERELADPAIQLRVSDLFERAPLIGAGLSWKFNCTNGRPQKPEPSRIAEES